MTEGSRILCRVPIKRMSYALNDMKYHLVQASKDRKWKLKEKMLVAINDLSEDILII